MNDNKNKSCDILLSTNTNNNNTLITINNTSSPINILSDASTISLDLVATSAANDRNDNNLLKPNSNDQKVYEKYFNYDNKSTSLLDNETPITANPDILLEKSPTSPLSVAVGGSAGEKPPNMRKRQSSTVTYSINVINFQNDNHPDDDSYPMNNKEHGGSGGGGGGRSNSSTSKNDILSSHMKAFFLLFFIFIFSHHDENIFPTEFSFHFFSCFGFLIFIVAQKY